MGTDAKLYSTKKNTSCDVDRKHNFLVHEEALATWADSAIAASTSTIWYANLILPAGYKLNVVTATAIASGVMCTAEGSDF